MLGDNASQKIPFDLTRMCKALNMSCEDEMIGTQLLSVNR